MRWNSPPRFTIPSVWSKPKLATRERLVRPHVALAERGGTPTVMPDRRPAVPTVGVRRARQRRNLELHVRRRGPVVRRWYGVTRPRLRPSGEVWVGNPLRRLGPAPRFRGLWPT